MAALWLKSNRSLSCEHLGSITAVFNPETGETHLLNELPALVLRVVDERPAGVPELIRRLAGPAKLGAAEEGQVGAALAFLQSAELVESV